MPASHPTGSWCSDRTRAAITSPDSDLDILVVMPVSGSRRKQAAAIELALVGVDLPTDVIVATPEEVARLQRVPGSIIKPAIEEGRVVYER